MEIFEEHVIVAKKCARDLSEHFRHLIELSLTTSHLPELFRLKTLLEKDTRITLKCCEMEVSAHESNFDMDLEADKPFVKNGVRVDGATPSPLPPPYFPTRNF